MDKPLKKDGINAKIRNKKLGIETVTLGTFKKNC